VPKKRRGTIVLSVIVTLVTTSSETSVEEVTPFQSKDIFWGKKNGHGLKVIEGSAH
jgi:hypothetical protein